MPPYQKNGGSAAGRAQNGTTLAPALVRNIADDSKAARGRSGLILPYREVVSQSEPLSDGCPTAVMASMAA